MQRELFPVTVGQFFSGMHERSIDECGLSDAADAADENRASTLGNEVAAQPAEEFVPANKQPLFSRFKSWPRVPFRAKHHAFDRSISSFDLNFFLSVRRKPIQQSNEKLWWAFGSSRPEIGHGDCHNHAHNRSCDADYDW